MKERFKSLDGLRGVAILMVTLFHLWREPGEPTITFGRLNFTPLFPYGAAGVTIFYCLSGFCLFYPLAKARQAGRSWPGWGGFYLRRAVRILPPYYIALVVWLPLWASWRGWDHWPRYLLTHLVFIHTLFPDTKFSINGVLWFMGPFMHFIILFPLLAMLMRRLPLVGATLIVVGSIVASQMLLRAGVQPALVTDSVLGFMPLFVFGMLAAYLSVRFSDPPLWLVNLAWAVGLIRLCLWPYLSTEPLIEALSRWGLMPQATTALLIWAMSVTPRPDPERGGYLAAGMARLFAWRPLIALGAISYSLFLYNYLLAFISRWFLKRFLTVGSPIWWLAMLVSIIAVATVAYYLTEKPFSRLRQRVV